MQILTYETGVKLNVERKLKIVWGVFFW